jgi:hypothetical protein
MGTAVGEIKRMRVREVRTNQTAGIAVGGSDDAETLSTLRFSRCWLSIAF